MWWKLVAVGLMLTLLSGCGWFGRRSSIDSRPGASQQGVASWYGPGFHGNKTSSGEIYDQHEMTAAHQTLPLGTRVAVTNLNNGRQVEVRVNDRGPFAKGRIIDLSYAAASSLDMLGPGTAPVRVEVLAGSGTAIAGPLPNAKYAVQVGAFADQDNAERLRRSLAKRFDGVYIATLDAPSGRYYRVRLGRFNQRGAALKTAQAVTPFGFNALIVEDNAAD